MAFPYATLSSTTLMLAFPYASHAKRDRQ